MEDCPVAQGVAPLALVQLDRLDQFGQRQQVHAALEEAQLSGARQHELDFREPLQPGRRVGHVRVEVPARHVLEAPTRPRVQDSAGSVEGLEQPALRAQRIDVDALHRSSSRVDLAHVVERVLPVVPERASAKDDALFRMLKTGELASGAEEQRLVQYQGDTRECHGRHQYRESDAQGRNAAGLERRDLAGSCGQGQAEEGGNGARGWYDVAHVQGGNPDQQVCERPAGRFPVLDDVVEIDEHLDDGHQDQRNDQGE